MPGEGLGIQYRRYRAPRLHGQTFVDPPLATAPSVVQSNVELRRQYGLSWAGRSIHEIAAAARAELVLLARDYTRQYRDVDITPIRPDTPLLLSGHQPQLFHPGVWYKNFLLARLAEAVQGVAINLVIDNDASGSASIRVPTGSVADPRLETVPYDQSQPEVPYEEQGIQDREAFLTFSARASRALAPFITDPLLNTWWPTVIDAARVDNNRGRTLARARHRLEGEWGIQSWELPLSTLSDTTPFRQFLLAVLADLARFRDTYNTALREYRAVNHVRSRSHPVPELQQEGEWHEAPFWIWTADDPVRRRLFVRRIQNQMELTDRKSVRWQVQSPQNVSLDECLNALAAARSSGIKLRPRALMTTMYTRLVLSDLFVHGIGGGKYDQLTDAIVQRFFGIEAPQFLVATATAKLPVTREQVKEEDLRAIDHQLRDLKHNPDRHTRVTMQTQPLIEAKKDWLAVNAVPGQGRERHQGITQANEALQPYVADLRTELLQRREQYATLLRHDRLLGSREFAFCLFPTETLQALLLDNS